MKRSKIKKEKYIHSRDDQKSAVGKISDAVSPVINEMDGKPVSGRGYTHNTHTHTHTHKRPLKTVMPVKIEIYQVLHL